MYSALELKQLVPEEEAGFLEQGGKHWMTGTETSLVCCREPRSRAVHMVELTECPV